MQWQTPTPALRALPVTPGSENTGTEASAANGTPSTGSPSDSSNARKFYTISVGLREAYDSNRGTSNNEGQGAFGTSIQASVLASHAFSEDQLTLAYTFSVNYYETATDSGEDVVGSDTQNLQMNHDLNLREIHTFSERTQLTIGDDFTYGIEPQIYENAGTPFNNGEHITNLFSANLSYQWTPRVGLIGTYANTYVNYFDQLVADEQNNVEQSMSGTASVSVLPKLSATFGVIVDDAVYETAERGYIDFTGFGGAQWQVNPDLSVSGRAGATFLSPQVGEEVISPYILASLSWTPTPRSQFSFSYSHAVSPSSQTGAQAQISDSVSSSLNYDFFPKLSGFFQASFTQSQVPGSLTGDGQIPVSENEFVFYFSPGLTYRYNSYLSFNAGISYSGNQSDTSDRNYTREEVYLGVGELIDVVIREWYTFLLIFRYPGWQPCPIKTISYFISPNTLKLSAIVCG